MQAIDETGKVYNKAWNEMNEEEIRVMQDAFKVAQRMSDKVIKAVIFGEVPEKKKK